MAVVLRVMFLIGCPVEQKTEPFTLSAFNDELSHYNYVRFIAEHNYRPIQEHSILESYPLGLNDYEYYQPPLYYTLAGHFLGIIPEKIRGIHAIRALNILFSLLLIPTVGKIMLKIEPAYVFASMIFLTVHPATVFFSSTVTNDVLLWLVCALAIYYGVSLIETKTLKNRVVVCLCAAIGIWTKLSALTLLPALIYLLYITESGKIISKISKVTGWIIFTLIWTVPLFWRNYVYYDSILPMHVGLGQPDSILSNLAFKKIILALNYIVHSLYFPFENYWIGTLQAILFLLLGIVTIIIIFFALRYYLFFFRKTSLQKKQTLIFLSIILICTVSGLIMMTLRYNQSEARLTFIALPVITLILIKGLDQLILTVKVRFAQKRKFDLTDVIRSSSGNQIDRIILLFSAIPYLAFVIH